MSKHTIRVDLEERLYKQLKALCPFYGSMSHFIREAIRREIERRGKSPWVSDAKAE